MNLYRILQCNIYIIVAVTLQQYLRNSGDYSIEHKPRKCIVPEISADANHLSHHDAKEHGRMVTSVKTSDGNTRKRWLYFRLELKLTTA